MNDGTFQFQDPGEGINEAEVSEVLVKEGDQVTEGQDVLVVETDKAAFELASPRSGTIESVRVSAGDVIHVGDTLLVFDGGEASSEASSSQESDASGSSEAQEPARSKEGPDQQRERNNDEPARSKESPDQQRERSKDEPARSDEDPSDSEEHAETKRGDGRSSSERGARDVVPATPATRRIARELGVDLTEVPFEHDAGRVRVEDVEAFARRDDGSPDDGDGDDAESGGGPASADAPSDDGRSTRQTLDSDSSELGPVREERLRSVRRAMARHMSRAWEEIPHVTHQDALDITELEQWRQRLAPRIEEGGGKLTLTVLVVKALCSTLRDLPRFNASFDAQNESLVIKEYHHIGVAVDTERGLVVPVLRDAGSKSLRTLARELTELAERARAGDVAREDLTGSSFTVTNVGGLGGTGFTPIINHPDVAILGLARARLQPVVRGDLDHNELETRLLLPVCLGFDHRVIDGAEAARFVASLGEKLSSVDAFCASA